jgi:hypothetical protein
LHGAGVAVEFAEVPALATSVCPLPNEPASRRSRRHRAGFGLVARALAAAGTTYVSGCLVGLFVAPPAPAATADAATVHGYFVGHEPAILLQSLLVPALPGVELAVLALTVAATTRSTGRLRHGVIATGVAAAVVSLTQVGLAVAALATAAGAADVTTQTLFHAINIADTVKLAALAGFVTTATLAARRAGMRRSGSVCPRRYWSRCCPSAPRRS